MLSPNPVILKIKQTARAAGEPISLFTDEASVATFYYLEDVLLK